MSRVNLFVVLAIILIVSVFGFSVPAQSAGEEFLWKNVGAEPNQLDQYESLQLMGLGAFSDYLDANSPSKFCIEAGVRLDATTFGKGKLCHHVQTDYGRSRRADVWLTWAVANMEVYRFQECGNFAYRVNWKPLDQSPIPGMIDEAITKAFAAHTKAEHHGLPWWLWLWLILLTLAVIVALLRRGRPGLDGEDGMDGEDGKDGKDAEIIVKGTSGYTVVPAEGARVTVVPTSSSAVSWKSNPGAAENGSIKPVSKMTPDELVDELMRLKEGISAKYQEIDCVIIPVIEETRKKLAELTEKKGAMRALVEEINRLVNPPKPVEASKE